MRHTEVTGQDNFNFIEEGLQEKLDAFWNLIEDKYEDEWRVEYSGAMTLLVTDVLLERILKDNPKVALEAFGTYEEHNPEDRRYEWLELPEYLMGLYSIEGVYSNHFTLVDGERSYFFEMGY